MFWVVAVVDGRGGRQVKWKEVTCLTGDWVIFIKDGDGIGG